MVHIMTAATPLVKPGWRRVSDLSNLVDIFQPEVQVCAWPREIDPAITTYLESLGQTGTMQVIETLQADDQLGLSHLPAGPGRNSLIDDLSLLRDIVCELLGCPAVGLRVARLGHAMCPGWHIDRTGIRLVCTYQGPGTEWLVDQSINRCDLNHSGMEDRDYIQASAGEIILLKGELWQGNELFGSVHRSPELTASNRLRTLVTIDPLW
jgi:hypothetical protein